jgi:hypothetical protein
LTFIGKGRRELGLRPEDVLDVIHHKAPPPLYEVERAAGHAIDSARLEGASVSADFLHDVIDEALTPIPERISGGMSRQREK